MIYTTQPYAHQKEALEIMFGRQTFALFCEQGTGKSKIVVDETVNMIEQDLINCVVVIAPNQVHANWQQQFELHGPVDYDKWCIQVYKSGSGKKQEQVTRDIIKSGKVLVFLMNVEALSHKSGTDYLHRVLRARRKTYLCVDESHKIKSHSASRTKNIIALGTLAKYRRIATGTEAEEGLIDLYAQFKFLDWNIIGFRFVTLFKSMYCQLGGYENRQIIGYRNQTLLAHRIAPYTYNKRKHECLDLPDKVYVTHNIELTPEQKNIYSTLEEELLFELENNTLIDATLALSRFIYLQQVLSGHLKDAMIPSNRAKFVAEIIDATQGKTIVFCRFVNDVKLVCTELGQAAIGIIGSTPNRLECINLWRQSVTIKALVITTQIGGVGLTLNESSNVVYYSNSWSSTDRLQSEDRCHRIGQVNRVTYHDLIVKGKLDEMILKALRKKTNLADKFRTLLAGAPGEIRHFMESNDA